MKFSLTPALTAELTVNTDFAQAEVDEAVVNLTRFPLFFPEKREFFLERAGIFEFGLGGRRGGVAERNLQMYFSRRIGLTDDRRPVPIIGGAKVTGRAAGLDLGVLNVQTADFDGAFEEHRRAATTPSSARSATSSRARTSGCSPRTASRPAATTTASFGADANFTVFKNTDIQGFSAGRSTPGTERQRHGRPPEVQLAHRSLRGLRRASVLGPDFQHDVGFVRRRGIQRTDTAVIWEPRPGGSTSATSCSAARWST